MSRTDEESREISAAIRDVYAALVDPRMLERWLPPQGMTGHIEWMDAHVGGTYRMLLAYAESDDNPGKTGDGNDVVEGRFVEIIDGVSVVQTIEFPSDDPSFSGTMTMSWLVEPTASGTLATLRAENVPAGISAADHRDGLRSSLRNLAALVESHS
ncbi:SRPBCC domain-containing protein [Microbacterium esteraromaticum]|uniref:SRPBCC domain-containing protein n=1 Tax=Microbacterium esteraromaticum TaxID=57043 RepID=UPI0015C6D321|nr:SRPBCC domain-containing protein [Microbacterium esteraromaticum]MBN8425281.1 SRPBCC domain-containing protein [Microbacterium esteraromaticum]